MNKDKKNAQLGLNYSTASHRLVKDILWNFVCQTERHFCYHCNRPMTRDTFSIEHKEPWLDSGNPVELFYDLNNIAFSHLRCNVSASRPRTSKYTKEELKAMDATRKRKEYTPEKRKLKYENTGH